MNPLVMSHMLHEDVSFAYSSAFGDGMHFVGCFTLLGLFDGSSSCVLPMI